MVDNAEEVAPAESGTVVIEDEDDIRNSIASTLRERGWTTHAAATRAPTERLRAPRSPL